MESGEDVCFTGHKQHRAVLNHIKNNHYPLLKGCRDCHTEWCFCIVSEGLTKTGQCQRRWRDASVKQIPFLISESTWTLCLILSIPWCTHRALCTRQALRPRQYGHAQKLCLKTGSIGQSGSRITHAHPKSSADPSLKQISCGIHTLGGVVALFHYSFIPFFRR